MAVKKTGSLKVAPSQHIASGHLRLHPNDGFDIGLMTKTHHVDWCTGILVPDFLKGDTGTVFAAKLDLLNECPQQTLMLNMQQWKQVGSPENVVLLYDGQRMYLCPLKIIKKSDDY